MPANTLGGRVRRAPVSRAARRWSKSGLCLLLVLVVLGSTLTGAQSPFLNPGAMPLGAATSGPQQRSGSADTSTHAASGEDTRANRKLPGRDQPRPAGAVADQADPLPEVRRPSNDPVHVTPKVEQARDLPAIDEKAVERGGDRTETTQTFDNPDGTRTLRLHNGQANVQQPDGSWRPVDLNLVLDGGRLRPKTGPLDLSLAPTSTDPALVRLAFDADHVLTYALRDAAESRGEVSGAQVTYRGVRPGADLRLTPSRVGVKEDLLLNSADATSSYAFTLKPQRLEPRLTESGSVELVDGDEVVAVIPAGYADDANGSRTTAVRYGLDRVDEQTWTLRVELDTAWLRDPARAFPVTLDPTAAIFKADTDDMYVRSNKVANNTLPELEVGRVEGQPTARSYLRFNGALGTLRNKYIVGATLNLDNIYSGSCTPRSVTVFEVTEPWKNSWPGAAVGQALSSRSFAHGQGCGNPAWVPFPLDADLMTRWTHGGALNHGFSLRASNEAEVGGRRFASGNTPNQPYLDVRYAPEGASFEVTGVTLPTNNRTGKLSAKVTNLGSSTWSSGGGIHFGFIVKQGDAVIRTQHGYRANVAPMQTHHFVDIPMEGLAPGDYQVYLTMFTPENQNFLDAHGVPFGRMNMTVSNVAPGSPYQQPGNGAVVENRTPTLYAEGKDDDNWPNRGLTYKFRICTDAALTLDCQEAPDWGGQSWTPSTLRWNATYHWGVKVFDGVDATSRWVDPQRLTTRVPQPQITSHLAGTPNANEGPGLDANIGNYTTAVTDASVPTVGPDLTITRTYNSLDPRRDSAFGVGWASRLDMRLRFDDDESGNVVITHPTGRQVRYGRNTDGTFASPSGSTADLVHTGVNGIYTLRDSSGSRWEFDGLGRLVSIIDAAGLVEKLDYNTSDQVKTITNQVSGRALSLTWLGSRVATVTVAAPERLVWTYSYVGDRLSKACMPGAAPNCTNYGYGTGSHYRSSVLDDAPKAYWRLGETEGDKFADVTARRDGENSATHHDVILGLDGALGGTSDTSAVFDGANSYVTLPDDLTPKTMSLAVELWFKTSAHGTLLSYADQSFPAASTKSTPILYVGTDGLLYGGFSLRDTGGSRQIVSPEQVDNDEWHHAVLSGSIDKQTLYLDGAPVGELSGLIDHKQQGKLTLGAGSGKDWPATNGGAFHFDGGIDEVAVYGHPVGALAARQHFASRSSIDALTTITLPQDDRQFARLTYDDLNDRVKTLVDHQARTWTLDTPKVRESTRTAVLRGPSNHGDWTYTFDIDNGGRLTSRSHNGAARKYEYNTAGYLSATVDETGLRTEQTTDARGNRLSRKTCRAAGSCNTTYFTYLRFDDPLDPRGDKLESISDARSADANDTRYRTTFTYDAGGRLTKTTWPVPSGHIAPPTEVHEYSQVGDAVPAGLPVKTTGRRGQVTLYDYAPNGDLTETTDPAGLRTQYAYDSIGRQKSVTAANSGGVAFGTVTTEYTPRSQVEKVTEPPVVNPITGVTHTKVTTFRYDGNGNVLENKISDATGGDPTRTTTMAYDGQDRITTTTFPDGGVERRFYADDGLTEVVSDVKGILWTTQSDERGLALSRSVDGAGVNPEDPDATGMVLESHVYDAAGKLQSTSDAIGRTTSYRYYDDGLPSTVVRENYVRGDQPPVPVTLEDNLYDPAGNLVEAVTAGGRKTVDTYDAANLLTARTFDPQGVARTTTYTRDLDGNPTRVQTRGAADPNRVETSTVEHDAASRVLRVHAHPDATTTLTTTYDYDERGLVEAMTDRRGLTTSHTYDAIGQEVTTTSPETEVWVAGARTPGFAQVETVGRNVFGELTHVKDPAGGVATVEYDLMGREIASTAPAYTPPGGQTIKPTRRTEYDHAGRAIKVLDPLNRVTSYDYDPYGRVRSTTLPQVDEVPSVIRTAYDKVGEVLSVTDPSGAQTEFTYDELGRRITSTQVDRSSGSALYYRTNTDYDLAGNVVAVTNPVGAVTTATYNAAGEVLTATDATKRATSYTYDIAGRMATTTDPTGLVSAATYDLLGRKVKTAQLVDGVEQRAFTTEYDPVGNLIGESTPEGRARSVVHDELGRAVSQVEQVSPTKSITTGFGYDKLGNRSRFVDGKGNTTTYTFTSLSQPESIVEPTTTTHPDAADRTWTTVYDAAGQVKRMTKPGGVTVDRDYDAQGRITSERGSGAEAAATERSFGYDRAGRLTRVGGPTGDSGYRYDDRGNLLQQTGAAGNGSYTYNGDGTVASRTDASGTAAFGYDKAGRITSVVDALTGRTVDYGYDPAGRTAVISDRSVSGWIRRNLEYDGLGRLTADQVRQSADAGVPPEVVIGTEYGYDRDGKVTSKTTTDTAGSKANTYGYDGAGRLTSWKDNAGTTTAYQWDDAGNRTAAGSATFDYDQRNRLKAGGGASYTYTARGTRASVTENGQTTNSTFDAFDRMVTNGIGNYSYDSNDRVISRNSKGFQYAGLSNEAVSDGSRLISRLPDGRAFADKAASSPAKGRMLYADQRGDVVGRYLGGSVDGVRSFDPFGKVTSSSGDTSPLGYQGDWTDSDTGAVNMSARWYSPGAGQFASRDDWTLNPMPSAAGNRYQYGNNDPVNTTDPTGHAPFDPCDALGPLSYWHKIPTWVGIPVDMVCGAQPTASGCMDTIQDENGNPCPGYGRCPDGRLVQAGKQYCASGPYSKGFHGGDDALTPGRCNRKSCTTSGKDKQVDPGRPGRGLPSLPPVFIPPPPPPWLIFAFRVLTRLGPGTTVVPRPPSSDITPGADQVEDRSDQLEDETNQRTEEEPARDPRISPVLPDQDDRDFCESLGMTPDMPVPGQMEEIKYTGKYTGKPRSPNNDLAYRATSGSVCLNTTQKVDRKTPQQPAGIRDDADYVKGHVVAHVLHGSNKRDNMVPLHDKANSPDMKNIEMTVRDRVNAGEAVYYKSTPVYLLDNDPVPIYVRIHARGNQGFTCDVVVYNIQGGGASFGYKPQC